MLRPPNTDNIGKLSSLLRQLVDAADAVVMLFARPASWLLLWPSKAGPKAVRYNPALRDLLTPGNIAGPSGSIASAPTNYSIKSENISPHFFIE
jgi:hypothetical protein